MQHYTFHSERMIRQHNAELEKKEKKKIALSFANMRMKQLAPMAFVKDLPKKQQKRLEGQVHLFFEDQKRQLERRKGKAPTGTWMFV